MELEVVDDGETGLKDEANCSFKREALWQVIVAGDRSSLSVSFQLVKYTMIITRDGFVIGPEILHTGYLVGEGSKEVSLDFSQNVNSPIVERPEVGPNFSQLPRFDSTMSLVSFVQQA